MRTLVRKQDWLWSCLLAVATFVFYFPTWQGLPIWDDWDHLTKARLASLEGLKRIWLRPGVTQRFDPLLDTAFWLQAKLWGDSPLGYHLVTIACHVACALLVVMILRKLEIKGAWLVAAIFALHPVHVESVAWITELKNTLSGVFYLGAALVYLEFDEKRRRSSYAAAGGLFLCALLSKTTAVTWPLGLLVILWWKRGRLSWSRDVLPLVPFAALAIVDGGVAMWVERAALGPAITEVRFTLLQRLLIASRAFWFYLGKLFWPSRLCPIYPLWRIDEQVRTAYLYPLALLMLLFGLWSIRKRNRAPLAAVLFFVVTLGPLLGVVSFSYQRYSFVADHFQYLASLGIITLAAAGAVRLRENWHASIGASMSGCIALLALLGTLTWRHSWAYTNLEKFTQAVLAENPESWAGHDFLGLILTSQEKVHEAVEQFNIALQGNPRYALGHYNLGCVLELQGKLPEAVSEYQQAIQLQPTLLRAHYNLGCVLATQGDFKDAMEQYEDALQIRPDSIDAPDIHNNFGIALASSGKLNEAIDHFQEAVRLRPEFPSAQRNLDQALALRDIPGKSQTVP